MASKQVIETDRINIGAKATQGLYVGSSESKYVVLSDSACSQTVLYDKVNYNFEISDLSSVVPAYGGTYTISGTSTRTHGNGSVDSVSFSPTTITIAPNYGGDAYSSASTITQSTSNLTDSYNFSVEKDSVTSVTLTLGTPNDIHASGGTVSSCPYTVSAQWKSGWVTDVTSSATMVWSGVSANSLGTTVKERTAVGTLYGVATYNGVSSSKQSVSVYQGANAVTSYGNVSLTISSVADIPASGGSVSTAVASASQTISYTSTATRGGSVTLSYTTVSASTKGTTASTRSSVGNMTVTASGEGSKSASGTITVYQEANTASYGNVSVTISSVGTIPAGGGSVSTAVASASQTVSYTSTATRGGSVSLSYTTVSASTKGTTLSDTTSAGTMTVTGNGEGSKTGTATITVYQAANTRSVTSIYLDPYQPDSSWIVTVTNGNWNTCPASGGYIISKGYWTYTYTSGSQASELQTSDATLTFSSGYNDWITKHDAGYHILSRGTTTGNSRTVTVTWSSTGFTTTKSLTQQENKVIETDHNPSNYDYTGSVSIGDGLTAAGGSATVSYSASHTHRYYYLYTSNSTSGPYYSYPSDSASIAITSNGNDRFSLNGSTLSHSSMGTHVTTDTVTVSVYNRSYSTTSAVNSASKSIENTYWTDQWYNTGWTASVSIGSGLSAGGGSAAVSHSASHTYYYRYKYTSGSYAPSSTGYYSTSVGDTSTIAISENGNSRFSLNGNTLSHGNMTTNATTDYVTVVVYNTSYSTSTALNSTRSGITNEVWTDRAYNDNWYVNAGTITNNLSAGGGSASWTSGSAGHTCYYRNKYTSGSYAPSSTGYYSYGVGDSVIRSIGGTRFSQSGDYASHSSMGCNATTDTLTVYWANASHTSTVTSATASVSNAITSTNYSPYGYYVSKGDFYSNTLTAAGGSIYWTSGSAGHYAYDQYTSGDYNNAHHVADGVTRTIGGTRFSQSGDCASHSSMGCNATTDTLTVYWLNATKGWDCYDYRQVSVSNGVVNSNYSPHDYYVSKGDFYSNTVSAGGGSVYWTSGSAGHYAYDYYTSGDYNNNHHVADSVERVIDSGSVRFSQSGDCASHSSMVTSVTTDTLTVYWLNGTTRWSNYDYRQLSVSNAITNYDYSASNYSYTGSISIGSGLSAGGGSALVSYSASHTHSYYYRYTSNSTSGPYYSYPSDTASIAITSNGNSRFSLNGNYVQHNSMKDNATTDTVEVSVYNHGYSTSSRINYTSASVSNAITSSTTSDWSVTVSSPTKNVTAAAASGQAIGCSTSRHYQLDYYTSGYQKGTWPSDGFRCVSNQSWCTISGTNFSVTKNTGASRTATITVYNSNNSDCYTLVRLTQAAGSLPEQNLYVAIEASNPGIIYISTSPDYIVQYQAPTNISYHMNVTAENSRGIPQEFVNGGTIYSGNYSSNISWRAAYIISIDDSEVSPTTYSSSTMKYIIDPEVKLIQEK